MSIASGTPVGNHWINCSIRFVLQAFFYVLVCFKATAYALKLLCQPCICSRRMQLMTTVNILAQLAKALGPHCSRHLQTFLPGLIGVLADSKVIHTSWLAKCYIGVKFKSFG